MSEADRDKWDARYREGACEARRHASNLLIEHAPQIKVGQKSRALDLACGAGRNALHLARLGYRVDAVDISSEALRRGKSDAEAERLDIGWIEHDLDLGLPPNLPDYDLIIMLRFLNLNIVRAAASRLRPGGRLICEVHLQTDEAVSGPRGNRFRAAPGALRDAAVDLDILHYFEGITNDPDGEPAALAGLVATRPA